MPTRLDETVPRESVTLGRGWWAFGVLRGVHGPVDEPHVEAVLRHHEKFERKFERGVQRGVGNHHARVWDVRDGSGGETVVHREEGVGFAQRVFLVQVDRYLRANEHPERNYRDERTTGGSGERAAALCAGAD